ncbi:MAG: hypothetical protein Q8R32_03575 [bacterium]|nr:hypothetical protein [bacterium]
MYTFFIQHARLAPGTEEVWIRLADGDKGIEVPEYATVVGDVPVEEGSIAGVLLRALRRLDDALVKIGCLTHFSPVTGPMTALLEDVFALGVRAGRQHAERLHGLQIPITPIVPK